MVDLEFTHLQVDDLRTKRSEDGPEVCLIIRAKVVGFEQEIENFTTGWYEPPKVHHVVVGQKLTLLPISVESAI
jgi:hypothetical protein